MAAAWIGLVLVVFLSLPSGFWSSSALRRPVLSVRGGHILGKDADVVIGKDRELFHFSIDLKWLSRKLLSRSTWKTIVLGVAERLKQLHPGYGVQLAYRDNALDCLLNIAELSPHPSIRIFQYSLHTAAELAALRNKLVLYYIEEDSSIGGTPSLPTLEARKVLGDEILGRYINSEFVFMMSGRKHPYALAVRSLLKSQSEQDLLHPAPIDYPLLLVLVPRPLEHSNEFCPIAAVHNLLAKLGHAVGILPSPPSPQSGSNEVATRLHWAKGWRRGSLVAPLDLVACYRLSKGRVTVDKIRDFLDTAKLHAATMIIAYENSTVLTGRREKDSEEEDDHREEEDRNAIRRIDNRGGEVGREKGEIGVLADEDDEENSPLFEFEPF